MLNNYNNKQAYIRKDGITQGRFNNGNSILLKKKNIVVDSIHKMVKTDKDVEKISNKLDEITKILNE